MTRVLVLGGTGWLSSRIAASWVARGARVTCLARGGRPAPAGAALVVADRSHPDAYRDVAGEDWDEVVDVSSDPRAVAASVAALGDRVAHGTYVSSLSVYADHDQVGADETAALAEPLRPGEEYDYAKAKSAAELALTALAPRTAIVRPGLIVGPGDPTDRFGYWPARFAAAGEGPVLVPDAAGLSAQVIDVDDLADFIVAAGARAFDGVVNAIGPSSPLGEMLDLVRTVAGHTGDVRAADADWLARHGVLHWAGPRSLPLWLPADVPGFATRDGSAYRAAGGRIRPLVETVERTLADERERGIARARAAGLERSDELALLEAMSAGH
ncbi:NAD-dependent epimerase/dehydratase family protein [Microbacterium sp. 179-B 1A2 NHS]|uniref:NAD-dependent epimerase/dehydratase family protein n=1 Tax=Microbacterium sp. 179-B 1A2 NHS TaxID=3142383 RepID=UPI0039A30835